MAKMRPSASRGAAAPEDTARAGSSTGTRSAGSSPSRAFPDAVAFVVRLGFDAEAADHHPDILVNYKRVTLTYTTHSEGGLTEKDFDGAATQRPSRQRWAVRSAWAASDWQAA